MDSPEFVLKIVNATQLILQNLTSPMALCFVLGVIACFIKSDLRLPAGAYTVLSAYLLFAIGLKGGTQLSVTNFAEFWKPMIVTILLGCTIPILVYNIARRIGKYDRTNAAALAAHYGSVSAVTFIACVAFIELSSTPFSKPIASYAIALVAIMEIPGLIVALLIVRVREMSETQDRTSGDEIDPGPSARTGLKEALHDVVTGKSIVLLAGGMLVGFISGPVGFKAIEAFFSHPFFGVLCLFMLEMGILTATRLHEIKKSGVFIILFGILGPVFLGMLGIMVSKLFGLDSIISTVIATLCASASYIAAPAAVRIALPSANPSLYLTPAVGITFPFNLTLGIPIYYFLAQKIQF